MSTSKSDHDELVDILSEVISTHRLECPIYMYHMPENFRGKFLQILKVTFLFAKMNS